MSSNIPLSPEDRFPEVTHQGKTLQVGQPVLVPDAGRTRRVIISSIVLRNRHYWIGYDDDAAFCPWPLARPAD